MNNIKLNFLLEEFPSLLQNLPANAKGEWGSMNGQQMVEHFIDAILLAAGKIPAPLLTPAESLPKMRDFLFSDAPFQENIKNPLVSETPPATRLPDMNTAVSELQRALNTFTEVFKEDPSKEIINPFFGPLDYTGQVQLLHKHAIHHLKQFRLSKKSA
ncbi:hypothetical protein ACFSQD_17795 [Flavihumibacter stibioxidans]|uniref:DUF1569 domain-containing protein n=1 Tax=Flavihumibacter stibioxidans TaxID=1834163 RepID=A0ABR7MCF5_9BACT|nr:hypothetical protein [Flavihumibacter stibioxidans]MBC6492723.1 hypothetical protein [Flavihumibacter stibioxidans]